MLFSVLFFSVYSKRMPGLYGLNNFKLEFPIQAHRYKAIKGLGHPNNKGYIHVVTIESSILHVKFLYHDFGL